MEFRGWASQRSHHQENNFRHEVQRLHTSRFTGNTAISDQERENRPYSNPQRQCSPAELGADEKARLNGRQPICSTVTTPSDIKSESVSCYRREHRKQPLARRVARNGHTRRHAQVALFLARDASRYVTAHDLVVDGGITAGRTQSEMMANFAMFQKELSSARGSR